MDKFRKEKVLQAKAAVKDAEKYLQHIQELDRLDRDGRVDYTHLEKAKRRLSNARQWLAIAKNPPKPQDPIQYRRDALERLTESERKSGQLRPDIRRHHENAIARLTGKPGEVVKPKPRTRMQKLEAKIAELEKQLAGA